MHRLSLKIRFLLSISLIIFVFGAFAVIFTFFYSRNSFVANHKKSLELTTIEMAGEISQVLSQGSTMVEKIADHDAVVNYFSGPRGFQDEKVLYDLDNYNILKNYSAIYILSTDGIALVSTDPSFVGQNYGFRKYFEEAMKGNTYTDAVMGVTSGKIGYYFSHPIYDGNNKLVGVVVVKMDPAVVNNAISLITNPDILKIMFSDKMGIILFSNLEDRAYKSLGLLSDEEKKKIVEDRRFEGIDIEQMQYSLVKEKISSIGENEVGVVEFYDKYDKEDEILSIAKIKGFPFFIIVEQDLETVIAPSFKLAAILSIFLLLSVLFAFVMVVYIISRYLRPLEKFNRIAQKISEGDYSVRLDADHTSFEFDKLAVVFNKMIEDIKNSRENIIEQVKSQTQKILKHSEEMEKQQKAVLNILEDVEAEKDNAENLAEDLSKFKLAVENASDHIVITDKDGMVLYANKAAEIITGYSFAETVGKKAGLLWGGLMEKIFYKELWDDLLVKKQPFHGEIKNRRKNGEEYDALISISPILDERDEVSFFVGIERDITKEKEVDRAKTEFVSLASHQLRTPLSTIGWYSEMMLSGDTGELNPEQRNYLMEIAGGNRRMVNLVNALLNVSRIEVGTFVIDVEDVNIEEVAGQTIGELKPLIDKKKIKFNKTVGSDIGTIKADSKLLKIIFDNLLSNAVKYTPNKGQVDFEIKKENKEIVITVKDSGIGIPKQQQHNIYTKLFRADNAREVDTDGTGLGLYIVKSILTAAGGSISFNSEQGKGATFIVKLPETGMKKKEGAKSLM